MLCQVLCGVQRLLIKFLDVLIQRCLGGVALLCDLGAQRLRVVQDAGEALLKLLDFGWIIVADEIGGRVSELLCDGGEKALGLFFLRRDLLVDLICDSWRRG